MAVVSEVVYDMSRPQQELLCCRLPVAVALTESLKTGVQLTILPSPCWWFISILSSQQHWFYCCLLYFQHFHKLEGIRVVEAQGSVQLVVPSLNAVIGLDVGMKDIPHGTQEKDHLSMYLGSTGLMLSFQERSSTWGTAEVLWKLVWLQWQVKKWAPSPFIWSSRCHGLGGRLLAD